MRPTDVCHPNELRAPAPRAFPAPLATFAAGTSHGVLGSVRHDRGTGRFTTSEDRFGGPRCNTELALFGLATGLVESRAWAFSPHGADAIEPLTPLSQPSVVHPPPLPPSWELQVVRTPAWWTGCTGRRMRRLPRPPLMPPRESRHLLMIRDAFHR